MDVQIWTCIIVGFTFSIHIGIAIWSKAHTTGEFCVAGKGVQAIAAFARTNLIETVINKSYADTPG